MSGTSNRVILNNKLQGETALVFFDFTSKLSAGETVSTQVVTATVDRGTDAAPSSIISGAAAPVSGGLVQQKITAGVVGVIYDLLCTITTSAGQTLQLAGYLAITPNLP